MVLAAPTSPAGTPSRADGTDVPDRDVPAADGAAAASRSTATTIIWLLLVVILTQRLVIPAGELQVPLSLPLVLAVLLVAVANGALELDPVRLRLYCLAMAACIAVTVYSLARGTTTSANSLVFLVATYLIAVVRTPARVSGLAEPVHRAYLTLMTVASIVSIGQLGLQYLGVGYQDYLALLIPEAFLQEGYATGDPIVYGSDLHRSNAVLFLEPSFVGYFVAAAVVMALARRAPMWQLCVLSAGLVPTLSGNAIVIVLPGLVAIALTRYRRRVFRLLPALVIGVAIAAATPLAALYLDRTGELSASGENSSNLRLIAPYELLLPVWTQSQESIWLGNGPGAASDVILDGAVDVGAVLTPAIPKSLVEYGVLGAVPLLVFLGWVMAGDIRRRPWAWGIVLGYFVINAALLQTTLALGTVLLLRLIPDIADDETDDEASHDDDEDEEETDSDPDDSPAGDRAVDWHTGGR